MSNQKAELVTITLPIQEKTTDGVIALNKEDFAPWENGINRVLNIGVPVEFNEVISPNAIDLLSVPFSGVGIAYAVFMNSKKQLLILTVKSKSFITRGSQLAEEFTGTLKLAEDVFVDLLITPSIGREGSVVTVGSDIILDITGLRLLVNGEMLTFPHDGADAESVRAEVAALRIFGYIPSLTYEAFVESVSKEELVEMQMTQEEAIKCLPIVDGILNSLPDEVANNPSLEFAVDTDADPSKGVRVAPLYMTAEKSPSGEKIGEVVMGQKLMESIVEEVQPHIVDKVMKTGQGPRLVRILSSYCDEMSKPNLPSQATISRQQHNLHNALNAVLQANEDFHLLWSYVLYYVHTYRVECFNPEMMFRGTSKEWKGTPQGRDQFTALLNIIDLTANPAERESGAKKFKLSAVFKYGFSASAQNNLAGFYNQ